jgi:hypothetical protein
MKFERLENLVRINQMKREPPAQLEIDELVQRALARLTDAEKLSLSIESRFDLAYGAAHSLAVAALRFHGYRSENRYVVFQALQDTVGLPAERWRVLDTAHKKRNLFEYGGTVSIEEALVAELVLVARELETLVKALGLVPT